MNTRSGSVFESSSARNSWTVFFLSVLACLCVLCIERMAGIGWNFHPDAVTYVDNNATIIGNIIKNGNISAYFSQIYFFIAYGLGSSVEALITLNILIFSVTNIFIYRTIKDRVTSRLQFVSLLLIIFYPYRIHIAVHVLKDTLVIFFLVLTLIKSRAFVFPLLLMTVRTVLYLPAFLPRIMNVALVCGLISTYFIVPQVTEFIYKQESVDFSFRAADQVPILNELSYGVGVRALVWPLLYLTGGFFLTSPTLLMLPLALSQILSQLAAISLFNKPLYTFGAYISLVLVAIITPGFTTFYRYALPIFTILPLLLIYEKK